MPCRLWPWVWSLAISPVNWLRRPATRQTLFKAKMARHGMGLLAIDPLNSQTLSEGLIAACKALFQSRQMTWLAAAIVLVLCNSRVCHIHLPQILLQLGREDFVDASQWLASIPVEDILSAPEWSLHLKLPARSTVPSR